MDIKLRIIHPEQVHTMTEPKKQEGYSWQRITITQTIQTTQIPKTTLIHPTPTPRARIRMQARTAQHLHPEIPAATAEETWMITASRTGIKSGNRETVNAKGQSKVQLYSAPNCF